MRMGSFALSAFWLGARAKEVKKSGGRNTWQIADAEALITERRSCSTCQQELHVDETLRTYVSCLWDATPA